MRRILDMTRRLFSILLNTLATFMLLVSVITPHHHHGDTVCISTSCYAHENNDAGHECDGDFADCCPHHHHDNENDSENCPFDDNCVAKTSYVVSNQAEIKQKILSHDGNNNIHFLPVFLLLTSFYDTDAKFVHLTKRRYKERDFFRESDNVNRTNGLRAPPYSIA